MSDVCKHGILLTKYRCKKCESGLEADQRAAEAGVATKPQQITVMLKHGQGVVQIPIGDPAGFNLAMWVSLVRGANGVIADHVWIPLENILLAGLGEIQVMTQQGAPKGSKPN
jgi:hypothetical protein